jgi:transcriptional regulator with XRE-family HTH domain
MDTATINNISALLPDNFTAIEKQRAERLVQEDMRFMRNLVAIRRQENLDPEIIARRMGMIVDSVIAFESSDSDPKLSEIRRYANANNVSYIHNIIVNYGHDEEYTIPAAVYDYTQDYDGDDFLEKSDSPNVRKIDMMCAHDSGLQWNLLTLREKLGISRLDVAQKTGWTEEEVYELEAYYTNPTLSEYRRYAHILGVVITHDVILHFGESEKEMVIFND